MSDYRELPERVAAAYAMLIDAHRRADTKAPRCLQCGLISTLRVAGAEASLLEAMRREYGLHPAEEQDAP